MRIIEIQALPNGAHRNQTGNFPAIPTGWAEISEDVPIPETFPFVDLAVEGDTVVTMTAGVVPEPEPQPEPQPQPELEPTEMEQLRADVDFLAAMTGVSL